MGQRERGGEVGPGSPPPSQRGGSELPLPHPLSYKPGDETHLHGLVRSVSILESGNLLFIPAPSLTEHESVIREEGVIVRLHRLTHDVHVASGSAPTGI